MATTGTDSRAGAGQTLFGVLLGELLKGQEHPPTYIAPTGPRDQLLASYPNAFDSLPDFIQAIGAPQSSGQPALIFTDWTTRPNDRKNAHSEIVDLLEVTDYVIAVVPASHLDSFHSYDTRQRILERAHVSLIAVTSFPGVHTQFRSAVMVLRRGEAGTTTRIFDAASRDFETHAEMLTELRRLLKIGGGTTPHGYVAREPLAAESFGYRINDPRRLQGVRDLASYGDVVTVKELFDIVPGFHEVADRQRYTAESEVLKKSRLLRGRDIQRLGVSVAVEQDVIARRDSQLEAGDVAFRSIFNQHMLNGFMATYVSEGDLPLVPSANSVVVLRPKAEASPVAVEFVVQFLQSKAATDLSELREGSMHLRPQMLLDMRVPVPDERLISAITALTQARDTAAQWQEQATQALTQLFIGDTPSDNRERVLSSSRTLRQKIIEAQATEKLEHRVRARYPLPVAARWRMTEAELSKGRSGDAYRSILEASEVLLGYMASVGLALSLSANVTLGSLADLRRKLGQQHGPSLGDWHAVLAELTGRKAAPITDLIGTSALNSFMSSPGVDEATRRLKARRNDEAHVRGVDPVDLEPAIDEALGDLKHLLASASVLEDMPLVLAGSNKWNHFTKSSKLTYYELVGDHPVVSALTTSVNSSDYEDGSLYLRDTGGVLHLLRPFVISRTCRTCRTRSTFHPDRITGSTLSMKSFEHGHTESDASFAEDLSAAGLID